MDRLTFIKTMSLAITGYALPLRSLESILYSGKPACRQPVLFIGHGNPMHALADNPFTRSLTEIASGLPERPSAILVVSAHWETRGTHVLIHEQPPTIHDFAGFPKELFDFQYPAPGCPELARETATILSAFHPEEDQTWGLDHGTWTILKHMFPEANIPVYQVSLDAAASWATHAEIGRTLEVLRDHGVLVIGSGNIVHNLGLVDFHHTEHRYAWAEEFDTWVARKVQERDISSLISPGAAGQAFRLSVPTSEHYLPLLYTMAMSGSADPVSFPYTGIEHGSISMRCIRFG